MGKHYFKCNKLIKGMVVIFDYRLRECYNNGDDLILAYKDREMVIPHSELKKKALKIDTMLHSSDYGKPFKFYHFKWEPTDEEEINNKQQTLI